MTDFDPTVSIVLAASLWAWLIVLLYKSLLHSRHGSAGLPLAYVLSTTLTHIGALVHLIPTYDHTLNAYLASWSYSNETVAAGSVTSTLGILGFTGGVVLANRFIPLGLRSKVSPSPALVLWISKLLIAVGLGGTFFPMFAGGLVVSLPGVTAILSGFTNLLVLGICGLILHFALLQQRRNTILAVFGGAAAVVGIQMVMVGILGGSVAAAVTIISFALVLFRRKTTTMLKGLFWLMVASYFLIVASVGWLEIRQEVRAAVWAGGSLTERVQAFGTAVTNMKILDLGNQTHLEYLDTRMNQNIIIGKAVERLTAYPSLYTNGETILSAAFGWVPRAIWADKPSRGGSETVATITGQRISDHTTVGTGPIVEFYMDFGFAGVFLGMLAYGYILRWLDIRSARVFRDGNLLNASYFFAAGAAMIAPMTDLFFIVNGAVTSAIAAGIIFFAAKRHLRRRERRINLTAPR